MKKIKEDICFEKVKSIKIIFEMSSQHKKKVQIYLILKLGGRNSV